MAEKKNKTIEKARVEMNYLTGDAAVRRIAELIEKWDMDYNSGIACATKRGIEQGIEQGKKDEKIKIAKSLLKEKMPIEKIAEITELSEQEIEKLDIN